MRGQKEMCLICRHALKIRPLIPSTKRFASSNSNEPYILPRLVIDLDAADSKLVRRWEDIELEKEQAPPEQATVRGGSTIKEEEEEEEEYGTSEFRPTKPLNTLITMPPDLLNYALLGNPWVTRTARRKQQLRKLFESSMIQPGDTAGVILQLLTFNFFIDETERFEASGFPEASETAIVDYITDIRVFDELRRTISMLSRTVKGCQFLARNSTAILMSIRNCRKLQRDFKRNQNFLAYPLPAKMVLKLLNNLQLNMESKGVDFGCQLSSAGLYYAAKICNLLAMRKYLQIMCANSYATDWRTAAVPREIFQKMRNTDSVVDPSEYDREPEILRLLTGWEKDGIRQNGEKRSSSFASLSFQDSSTSFVDCLYPKYILALGELKCNKALWAEWKSAETNAEYVPSLFRGVEHMRFRARMFAFAFLVGGDKLRALEVLRSVPTSHEDIFIEGYQERIKTWTNDKSLYLSSGEWLLALIHDHYSFSYVWPRIGFLDKLKTAIAHLSKDPLEALNELDSFVLEGLDIDANLVRSRARQVGFSI